MEGPTTFVPEPGPTAFSRTALATTADGIAATADHYAREQAVDFSPGTCLLFRVDTWHRATGGRANERRLTQHIILRRADAEWISSDCWVPRFASPTVDEAWKAGLSDWQRETVGFPAADHATAGAGASAAWLTGAEAEAWSAHGWVAVEAERLWSGAALDEAAEVAAAQPVPDDTSAVFRPNGAMGAPHAHLSCRGPDLSWA